LLALCYCSEPVIGEDELWHFKLNFDKLQEFAMVNFSVMNDFMKEKKIK
jgi:hypothetical protein